MYIQFGASASSFSSADTSRHAPRAPLLLAALVSLGASFGLAAEPSQSGKPGAQQVGGHAGAQFIRGWDRDGDGKVSRAEYEAARKERFAETDKDGNSSLSEDEYANEYTVRLDQQVADERKASVEQTYVRFRSLDKDRDGTVSRSEYDASGTRSFEHLDQDKDGRLTKQDAPANASAAGSSGDSGRAARPRARSVINMPSTHSRAGFIEIHDEDDDGVVTREQYQALRAGAFTRTDSNADGKLSESEYVQEFNGRLDRQIERSRQRQLKQANVRFESIDTNKDGGIGLEEYFAMSTRMFERADTNKDGVVSAEDPPPVRERSASR